MNSIWIGYDSRESEAFSVAIASASRSRALTFPIILADLIRADLYRRSIDRHHGIMWDTISGAPMSTEFAISRFLVLHLAGRGSGWALFMDGDVLVRGDLDELFGGLDRKFALYCVKHDYTPSLAPKKDGQIQTAYRRKNWSSVMAFNLAHPAHEALTIDLINTAPGRDLHRFCWLEDDQIGALDPAWNWLVGEQPEPAGGAKIVHWTLGGPWLPEFANAPYANEYRSYLLPTRKAAAR